LGLISAIYGLAVTCRRFCHVYLKKPNKLPAKVISIGNLTLGGTGKTPAVIGLALEAKKRGFNPCILTRGYKGKAKGTCFVSKGKGPLLDTQQAGDEAFLMAETLKDIPVVKGRNRYEAGMFAIKELNPQPSALGLQPFLFILDDGFQHWKLHRDIDVLLIDATNPFGNEKVFPEGIMREPFRALKRADVIVITKTDVAGKEAISAITQKVKKHTIVSISGETGGPDTLSSKKIYAFAGIANHAYFPATLRSTGADIIDFRKFRDHHIYNQKDIDKIKKDSLGMEIITTEKDLVKLKDLQLPEKLSALRIEFSIDDAFYNDLFGRLK
jgi:tetraacyldisaccharide 4'-kinase